MAEVVGLIGAGNMGSKILVRLCEETFSVVVWDIDEGARDRALTLGATLSKSSAEVASRSRVVLLSLPMPSDVLDVVGGTDGLLAAEPLPRVIVDLSTIDPTTAREVAGLASTSGVGYLDAPVLGRPTSCGNWTLPVGGTTDDLGEVEYVLSPIARRIVHVGASGAGSALKLLNNLMFGAINAITTECMVGAARVGLDAEKFFTTVVDSNAASVSNLFRELGPKILREDFSPTFSLSLLEKDNRLAVEMLSAAGLESVVGRAVTELNGNGIAAGLGPEDTSALVKLLRRVEVRAGGPEPELAEL